MFLDKSILRQHYETELLNQKRELTNLLHLQKNEWHTLEVKLRETDANSAQELTRMKSELNSVNDLITLKGNEIYRFVLLPRFVLTVLYAFLAWNEKMENSSDKLKLTRIVLLPWKIPC